MDKAWGSIPHNPKKWGERLGAGEEGKEWMEGRKEERLADSKEVLTESIKALTWESTCDKQFQPIAS